MAAATSSTAPIGVDLAKLILGLALGTADGREA